MKRAILVCVAAVAIGVEVDDGYCAKAVARLEQWHAQGRLSLTANDRIEARHG